MTIILLVFKVLFGKQNKKTFLFVSLNFFNKQTPEKMASALEQYINHTVSIITADGRNFIGTLKGFDQTINVILDESHERVFSTTAGIEQIVLGLHIIRGDNIAVIGQIDETIDSRLDFPNIRGEPLGPVVH